MSSGQEYRKSREFTYGNFSGTPSQERNGQYLTPPLTYKIRAFGDQTTWSRDTLFPRMQWLKNRARARGDDILLSRLQPNMGAAFTSVKRTYWDDGAINRVITLPPVNWLGNIYRYSGPILGVNPSSGSALVNYPEISDTDLYLEMVQKGSTAIAQTIPTNPTVGAGQLIGETLQQLPKLPGAALLGRPGNVSKKFADEYLNYEFGLKPLASDIDGIARAVKNSNQILAQLERDSGRLIRRRYSFPEEISSVETHRQDVETSYPPLATRQYAGPGVYTIRRYTTKRMWFSGAYTYHFDLGDDLRSKLMRAEQKGNRLFGLRLSPSLAWELTPWSWAADWVSNAGDVITNISALSRDGLVLKWGYVMCEMRVTDVHTKRINLTNYGFIRSEQRFTTTVKKRIRATPYGFGLDPDFWDFSPRQLAILGALGISRGR